MKGEARVSMTDLLDLPFINDTFNMLSILKQKGMPVVGLTHLELDENYIYERRDDFETGDMVVSWKHKEKE